jgi:hypothetical protein
VAVHVARQVPSAAQVVTSAFRRKLPINCSSGVLAGRRNSVHTSRSRVSDNVSLHLVHQIVFKVCISQPPHKNHKLNAQLCLHQQPMSSIFSDSNLSVTGSRTSNHRTHSHSLSHSLNHSATHRQAGLRTQSVFVSGRATDSLSSSATSTHITHSHSHQILHTYTYIHTLRHHKNHYLVHTSATPAAPHTRWRGGLIRDGVRSLALSL